MIGRIDSRILAATVAAVVCLATALLPSAASAQTSYYWNGPDLTGNNWSDPNWAATAAGGGTLTGWTDGGNALIGYVPITSGATIGNGGGAYTAAVPVTLTGPVSANSLTIGIPQNVNASGSPFYYYLTNSAGSPQTLTIGNGGSAGQIIDDLGNKSENGYAEFNCPVTVAGTQDLQLSATSNSTSGYADGHWEFNAPTSFNNLVVAAPIVTTANPAGNSRNVAMFNSTAAFPANHNVTLGNNTMFFNAGPTIDPATGLQNTTTVGTINMSMPGSYTAASSWAAVSTSFIQVGAGYAYNDTVGGTSDGAPTVIVNGPIQGTGATQGQGDVIFGTGISAGGCGTVVLNSVCNYAGVTAMKQFTHGNYGTAGPTSGDPEVGIVQLGINNALPQTTDLSFGAGIGTQTTSAGYSGALDLHGFNQTVKSISTWTGSTYNCHAGVTNFGPSTGTPSMLTINDSAADAAVFNATIGQLVMGPNSQISASNGNIALTLAPTNIGSLTLGLTNVASAGGSGSSIIAATQSNSYTGGTTISGGALYAANGSVYWNGTIGIANGSPLGTSILNSATGTGPVTVNTGATLGGSAVGGAVGMPSTGLVTITNGGTLVPSGANWQSAASPGSFWVLGGLTLNSGSTVDLTYDTSHSDLVNVYGNLTLPTSGSVNVDINNLGGLQNGQELFSVGGLTNTFNAASLHISGVTVPTGDTLGLTYVPPSGINPGQIDLSAPWLTSSKVWSNLSSNTGVWDQATPNFVTGGSPVTYTDGDNVVFNNTGYTATVVINSSGVMPGNVTFANTASKAYTISGTGGSINGTTGLAVSGGGQLTLNNSNNYTGTTLVSNNSTLTLATTTALSASSAVVLSDTARLQFTNPSPMTFANNVEFTFGSAGTGASPLVDVEGATNSVNFSGVVSSDYYGYTHAIGFTKTGPGTLVLSNASGALAASNAYGGTTNINQGTVSLTAVTGTPGQNSYSALGIGNINILNGGTLQLANVAIGVLQNQTVSNTVGYVEMFTGATLQGTGQASYEHGSVEAQLNYNAGGASLPSSITLATGTSASDVLDLKDEFHQYDKQYVTNNYGNWVQPTAGNGSTGYADPTKLITAHVTGSGVVKLQDGGIYSHTVFGGAWSVDSGILQVGPMVPVAAADPNQNSTGWAGALGQPINALGFHTPNSSDYDETADPDLPNAVTVNAGGTLVVAVDQVNQNPNINPVTGVPVNSTPTINGLTYLRNPVTLNGGAIAASGYEVTFGSANTTWTDTSSGSLTYGQTFPGSTNEQGEPDSTRVKAQFGGNFAVTSAGGSVLTYDPTGNDPGAGRTVELVGGSRYLANASPGWAAGSVILYTTNWAGTLTVNPNGTTGGAFIIDRAPDPLAVAQGNSNIGTVTVAPGASISIMNGGVLDLGGVNSLLDDSGTSTNGNAVAVTVGQGAHFDLTNIDTISTIANGTTRLTIGGLTLDGTGVLNVDHTGLIILGATDATIRAEIIDGGIITSDLNRTVGYMDVAGGVEVAAVTPGDCNLDGRVDINDLTIVLSNYNKAGQGWSQGSMDGDPAGTVDLNDLTIVLSNYGHTLSAAAPGLSAVPEPSVLALLAAAVLGLLAYGWRRRV